MYYRIDDTKQNPGVFPCSKEEAEKYNAQNWGIFFTPNTFNGPRRIENLKEIRFWFIDIDKCDKAETIEFILNSILPPSTIVETKSGFHCYWQAKDATKEKYEEIENRLIKYYNADKQVKDLPRLMRVPGFYHCKDLNNRFLIKAIFNKERTFTENQMLFAFKPLKTKHEQCLEPISSIEDVDLNVLLKPETINTGERNGKIFKKGVFLKRLGVSEYETANALRWLNMNITNPLPEHELNSIIRGYNKWKI